MQHPTIVSVAVVCLTMAVTPECTAAQTPGRLPLTGVVREAGSGALLAGVHVRLEELNRLSVTDGEGRFGFTGVPVGTYRLSFRRLGFHPVTRQVEVADVLVTVAVDMTPAPIELPPAVVTGVVGAAGEESAVRPTNVVSGRDLDRKLQNTLAETLANEPGLAVASMGPAAAQPVLRGLSGDRVLVLEDGARTGDVAATSPDHAVAADAASAERIEVLRGPAALIYGSNALGGVINVIREEVPTTLPDHLNGSVSAQGQTVAPGGTLQGHLTGGMGGLAVRGEALARRAGDVRTPAGRLVNTDVTSYTGAAGVSSVNGWGHAGGAYRFNHSSYGVPGGFAGGHPQGVDIRLWRHTGRLETTILERWGPFESLDLRGNYVYYHHEEIEPGGILGTSFTQHTAALDVRGRHGPLGFIEHGATGVRAQWRDYSTDGTQDTPDTRTLTLAGFLLEEVHAGPVRVETGIRFDWARSAPADTTTSVDIGAVRPRTFAALSGSIGAVVGLGPSLEAGGSIARAFRIPDPNELYSQGPHLAVFSFEVGNPDLGVESAVGVDVFARVVRPELHAELAVFRNAIDGFLFARPTGDTLVRLRLPIFQFVGEDALLTGLEGRIEWSFAPRLVLAANGSAVRGTLTETDEPLPFMPPAQGRLGLRYEHPSYFVGADARGAAPQNRVGAFEEPTDGYVVYGASAGVRWFLAGQLHALTLRVDNIANREYRNHLNRVKSIMPEAGRDVSLLYRVSF